MDLNQIQFKSPDKNSVEGYLGDRKVSVLGWDSSNTVTRMETHPEMRHQGVMQNTWNAGVQQAGYLRHSPDRTPEGNRFARAHAEATGRKLPKRQSVPEYTSNETWD